MEHSLRLNFPNSNNQAEYKAIIARLLQVKENGAKKVHVSTNSQLVAAQIEETYQAKGPLMIKYLKKVKEIMTDFKEVIVVHIPRRENTKADILSKLVSTKNRVIIEQ